MIFFIIILIAIVFVGMQCCNKRNEFYNDYISPRQTSSINAIFTLLIFISHASQYITLGGTLDDPYLAFRKFLGQLVVSTFLFYSGFGIMGSISKKGMDYVKTIPAKRLFKVWYHFAIGLIPFFVLNYIFSRGFSVENMVLSFTGVKSMGNSNWYMCATFVMYIVVFISFIIARKHKFIGVVLSFGLTLVYAYVANRAGLQPVFYNTVFCYPAGILFSLIKPYFDKFVMKNDMFWAGSFCVFFALFYYFSSNRNDSLVHYNLFAIVAVILIILFTMKVKICNSILDWIGNHIFSLFFLQRIPMIFLDECGFTDHKYAFIIVSFIATVFIAIVFDEAMAVLDKLIYNRKKVKKA